MAKHRRNRTLLASGALGLMLMIFMYTAQKQEENPCVDQQGNFRNDILDASLIGTISGDKVQISIPVWGEKKAPNIWSRRSQGRSVQSAGGAQVLSASTNTILVPPNKVALWWLESESGTPTKMKLRNGGATVELNLTDRFQQVPSTSLRVMRESNSDIILMCDDNSGSTTDSSWYFELFIDGQWYDPQIQNEGGPTPPPPPPL